MGDTISRVESWLAIASAQYAIRHARAAEQSAEDAQVVNARRESPTKSGTSPSLTLDLVLASRPKQYARLVGDAAIVDSWIKQPPVRQVCGCASSSPIGHRPLALQSSPPNTQERIVERIVETYRTITRTNTGRIIDVVV